MRLFLLILLVAVGSWWIPTHGLDYLPQPIKTVTIYTQGSHSSALCQEISRELSLARIYNRKVDVSSSSRARDEMKLAVSKCGWGGFNISRYPVVVINNHKILLAPSPEKAARIASRPVFSWKLIKKKYFGDTKVGYITP